MKSRKSTLAALAGSLTLFVLGLPFYQAFSGIPEPSYASQASYLLLVILALEVGSALFLTLLYDRWVSVKTFLKGALNGAWLCSLVAFNAVFIGAFICIDYQLDFTALTGISTATAILAYTLSTAVRGAMAGGVIGWVLGRNSLA